MTFGMPVGGQFSEFSRRRGPLPVSTSFGAIGSPGIRDLVFSCPNASKG
jgi:hypothetical protein